MSDHDTQILRRLVTLLSEVTGTPTTNLSATSTPDNTRGWDSTANLQFITAVEEEFSVLIPTATALRLRSLADMVAFVRSTHAAQAPAQRSL